MRSVCCHIILPLSRSITFFTCPFNSRVSLRCRHRRAVSAYAWDIPTLPCTVSTNAVQHVCNATAPRFNLCIACFSAGATWGRAGMSLVVLKVKQGAVRFASWQFWMPNIQTFSPTTSLDRSLYKPLKIMLWNDRLQVWIHLYRLDFPYAGISPVW